MKLETYTRRWRPAELPRRPDGDDRSNGEARPVFRFAPSPNGPLHLGHALSAFLNFDMAQSFGGRFLLRIEDIDLARTREEHVTGIFDDLAWLGLSWEEPVLRQSEHFATYQAAAHTLLKLGLLYPCFATRAEIAEASKRAPGARDPDGAPLYPGLHKRLAKEEVAERMRRNEPFALRLDMDQALDVLALRTNARRVTFCELAADGTGEEIEADPAVWGDAIIVRKDTPTSYHLACVVDDARQGITHVVRGRDLYAATGLHRLLQVLLGIRRPVYHHHRLLTGPDGRKLAKSAGARPLAEFRDEGVEPAEVRARVDLGHQLPTIPANDRS
ncbi:glutamyl-Q tRNA(Asp) ligase [Hyphomicrobium nitrativorans NL23]|uniref:Glutamyl-Q tRNA(Asp) ligase n=1 Tax=Hyphomicrobium nitrativorans NL23 TaxID=1029756 RepID=V5SCH3_9HYPH|nr:tRNA glutamyl-Q(34) synthetase GluQRS [Hyphomicrobium nitrativorans]AHB47725.1 glutamyl-Q tRNA(Asp) ligase [Hyphomicrobium nitrativorans NL23]